MRRGPSALAFSTLVFLACGDPVDGGPDPVDAGPDASSGVPAAPLAPLQPAGVTEWLVSAPVEGDALEDAIVAGTFQLPASDSGAYGTTWTSLSPDEQGGVTAPTAAGVLYAATHASVREGEHLVAQTGPTYATFSNGLRQPGDVYNFRKFKAPVPVDASGSVLFVAQIAGGRGDARLDLWKTTDEVLLNLDDLTFPDLVEGDASERWLGVPVVNLSGQGLEGASAIVLENRHFRATRVEQPPLAREATTQVAFRLEPKSPPSATGTPITARIRFEAPALRFAYERDVPINVVGAATPYRLTRRSGVDGSVQYAGVQPPTSYDELGTYALVLSLHGAGVEAIGQAQSYAGKDWAFHVAPTNRRPFGFDWEEWGRLDALEALDDAMARYRIDPTRVYLTGHSMGGHGTWQVGVHATSRFAVIAPSAGWSSFQTYTGRRAPTGAFARAQASSTTNDYVGNLAHRAVFIIHGSADNVVPVREGRDMFRLVKPVTGDIFYHEEFGAGHWWDYPDTPGADCIDWPALFAVMQDRRLDPDEATFSWRTPSPWIASKRGFLTLQSEASPREDVQVTSALAAGTLTLQTTNARSLDVDLAGVRRAGAAKLVIDGTDHPIDGETLHVGPERGKTAAQHGPLNQAFQRPFCLVYPDEGPAAYRQYASWLVTTWNFIGNGHACALPVSRVTPALRADRNLVFLGLPSSAIGVETLPASWGPDGIVLGGETHASATLAIAFPAGNKVDAAIYATPGREQTVYAVQPFSSGAAFPDYVVFGAAGVITAGFFDAEWKYARAFAWP